MKPSLKLDEVLKFSVATPRKYFVVINAALRVEQKSDPI
jgi:hypothetical protein